MTADPEAAQEGESDRLGYDQWIREQRTRQGPPSTTSSETAPVPPPSPPPIYLYRWSPSNRSLISTRPPSYISAQSSASQPPPVYQGSNLSQSSTNLPASAAVVTAVPATTQSDRRAIQLANGLQWSGPGLGYAIVVILLLLIMLYVLAYWKFS